MRRSGLESFVAGAAFAAVATVTVYATAAAFGLSPRPALYVLGAGVVAAAVAGVTSRSRPEALPFRVGAIAAGTAALLLEVASGGRFGALAVTAAAASIAVAVVGPALGRLVDTPVPKWLAVVGLAAVALVLARVVIGGGELGHDEAAYALKARAWLRGTPDTGWDLHRGIGQSVIALAVLAVRESASGLRLVSVVLSIGTVVAVWALGRTMRSDRVGLAAAGMFAVAPSFLRRGAEFLTDLPSAGLLLVVALLLWRWATSESASDRQLYLAVVLAAAAFYIRYQAVLSLALLVVAWLFVGRERVRQRSKSAVLAAALGVALLLPHLIWASVVTGRPWGVIAFTSAAGRRAYLGEGLVDYVRDLPDLLAGQVGGVALVVAVGWLVWRSARAGDRRPALFLAIPALGQFLILGTISHGEPRFVFFPVALMLVAAATAADELRARIPEWAYRAGTFTFVVALVASLGLHGARMDEFAEARGEMVAALEEAAAVIEAEATRPCGVITGLRPQVTWLTGCHTALFGLSEVEIPLGPEFDRFLLFTEGGLREPDADLKAEYESLAAGDPIRIDGEGSIGDVVIWPLDG